jgi:hypothetical protein
MVKRATQPIKKQKPADKPAPAPLTVNALPLYRALRDLSVTGGQVLPRGGLYWLAHLDRESVAALKRCGAITEALSPPLMALPGWQTRGEQLGALGVKTVSQFVGTDADALAAHLEVKAETVQRWKQEATNWLMPAPEEKR